MGPSFWDDLVQTMAMQQNPQWLQDVKSGKTRMDNGDGSFSTLLSGTTNVDDGTLLFPGIRLLNGTPKKLSPKQALEMAMKMKDALHFPDQSKADKWDQWFHEKSYGASPLNAWGSP